MAGVFFTAGETKKRPGVYNRYENKGGAGVVGAQDGIVAVIGEFNWGELNKVVDVNSIEQAKECFGIDGGAGYDVISEVFAGGAKTARVVRVGSGGTKASHIIKDDKGADAIQIVAKSVGAFGFSTQIGFVAGSSAFQEFRLYRGATLIEKFHYPAYMPCSQFVAKYGKNSKYVDFTFVDGYDTYQESCAECYAETPMTEGTNPTVKTGDYSTALTALEPYRWNSLCLNTVDAAVHELVAAYMTRVYQDGKTGFAVLGSQITQLLEDRMEDAAAYNDYKIVYVGGGWYDTSDVLIDGARAAARIAGMVAATPSTRSLTHMAISGADRPAEMLTNSQYESTIDSGMLTFSYSPKGGVWIESGVTTLVNLSGEDDEGWKKIKRTKIRFELMDRVNDSVASLIGTINNDEDGRATIIQVVQGVLNAMVYEKKLFNGATVALDSGNAPVGDSAWFVIQADDIDSLEKVYFTYRFRFAINS